MHEGFDIVGVTTVYKNTAERARIAKMLMQKYGGGYEKVPVFAGHGTPIAEAAELYPHTCHYSRELEDDRYAPDGEADAAVDFIIDACKKWGDELVVVAIGPFTNIARAIEKDAKALSLASKIVIMGGAYFKQYADWNVMCDVEATNVMFSSLSNLECVGADVTHRLPLTKDQLDALCNADADGAVCEIAHLTRLWRKAVTDRLPALHDPLAIYYAACPDICKMTEQRVAVITDGVARGLTLNIDAYGKAYMNDAAGKVTSVAKVAFDVDVERFVRVFMSLFEK
jgi:purine nucleosidase/pyrimidine-specific ribonucleoside hydrolase